ncbi:GDNF-inducible zinc finger protein 1-like isoform X3 [Thrips palmi]|uniref:GDNF-inducible zinc finger protein 1-like isoform X3 n=1 Tax=Thrips palmi TaxID=161013 RepID=A0A6P8ZU82_THRPL|nr:GDNF-inducible zinc finger protein 1-like isoform X3 [Thrips palmi]
MSLELCRLCAARSDDIPIFGTTEYLPYKINFTLNIEVKESDSRKTICLLCKTKLTEFHDFKNMCRNTEAQGIGSPKNLPILTKIKEEPKDFQELANQVASVPVPNSEPIKLVPLISLPFLFKNDVKVEKANDAKSPKSPGSNSSVESSVDYLINQVDTDDSKSSLEDGKRDGDKGADSSEAGSADVVAPGDDSSHNNAAPTDDSASLNCDQENDPPENSASNHPDDDSLGNGASDAGGRRRGRKRRVPSPDVELKKRRLTRSSTGVLPKKKIIIDESEDDSDPDDPEYKDQVNQPETESESDEEEKSKSPVPPMKPPSKSPTKSTAKSPTPEQQANTAEDVSEEEDETEKKEEECVVCRKTFLGAKSLRKHMKEHLVKKKPVHECKHCGVQFSDKSKLICHNVLNHTSKPNAQPDTGLPCSKCDKTFKTSGELICHQVLNHNKK